MNPWALAAEVAAIIATVAGICWLPRLLDKADPQPLEQVRPIGDKKQDAAYLSIVFHLANDPAEPLFDDGRDW